MKPPPFDYAAPRSVEEAVAALADGAGKVLAGGQSLIPILNMRLAAPARLVDVNRVGELDRIEVEPDRVVLGALARHARVEADDAVAAAQPLLRQALRLVAHPVIRNRGTCCGSIAHADPSGELPAVLCLLDGSVRARSTAGARDIPAAEFFTGPLETALRPDELVTEVRLPRLPAGSGTAFVEVSRRHGDYAVAGVAAAVTVDDDLRLADARVAFVSLGPTPVTVPLVDVLGGQMQATADWAAAARSAADRTEPEGDIHASAAYRRHLAVALTERALRTAAGRAVSAATRTGSG